MRLPLRLSALFACAVLLALQFSLLPEAIVAAGQAQAKAQRAGRYVEGELIVQFGPSATEKEREAVRGRFKLKKKKKLKADERGELELAALGDGATVAQAIQALASQPGVRFAEPNWIYTHEAVSDDPRYTSGSLWGMQGDSSSPANPHGSQAAEMWSQGVTGSDTVFVGVIDEGIDIRHPDLAANVFVNPYDWPDGLDNDGNGYVDDVNGWDFYSRNATVYDGVAGNTIDAHGTHVAGTIGARGGNGTGVVGVNWSVRIISGKFLGPNGGTTADAVRAVNYFTDLKQRHGLNIVALNNSWGGGGYSQALHDAIIRAANANILFIAAAGNSARNTDLTAAYPANYNTTIGTSTQSAASYDSVVAVAALTSTGSRASFSNYGASTVDLGAPGAGIWSTTPNGKYSSYSGTSMATPHVTGAVALYASLYPEAAAASIRGAVLESARVTPTSSMSGITTTGGRLNIGEFLLLPPAVPPAAPTGLAAVALSARTVDLTWADNATNETSYRVERCSGTKCTGFALIAQLSADATTYRDTVPKKGAYRYRVQASNGSVPSAYSTIVTVSAP